MGTRAFCPDCCETWILQPRQMTSQYGLWPINLQCSQYNRWPKSFVAMVKMNLQAAQEKPWDAQGGCSWLYEQLCNIKSLKMKPEKIKCIIKSIWKKRTQNLIYIYKDSYTSEIKTFIYPKMLAWQGIHTSTQQCRKSHSQDKIHVLHVHAFIWRKIYTNRILHTLGYMYTNMARIGQHLGETWDI